MITLPRFLILFPLAGGLNQLSSNMLGMLHCVVRQEHVIGKNSDLILLC